MKIIGFPEKEKETKYIHEMLDQAKESIDELGITDAVLVTMDSEGNVGMAMCSDQITAHGIMSIALKSI